MRRWLAGTSLVLFAFALAGRAPQDEPRLKGAFRQPDNNGWIFVHLEGTPAEVGFQHGYLLAPEILDARRAVALSLEHDTKKDWRFFRSAAERVFWPKVEAEYRQELQGIADGLKAKGAELDLGDVVALNAWLELAPYYTDWYDARHASAAAVPERCSAFVATGSYTQDGRVVMGHNAWTGYMEGWHWRIIFDLHPARGHRILMDGYPGLIHSADDFGLNSAGILITETTISQFRGFDPDGVPEFVRARKAMQYSASIDDFERIMRQGNNGGYANNWLVADRKTNEIASLELGLKNVNLRRTKDGYFGGANFPVDEKLAREETTFSMNDRGVSANARRIRWNQLMKQFRGKIDTAAARRFLSDHLDTFTGRDDPNERTLCGHIDLSPRGSKPWQPEFGACGAVQAKVADARMAEQMSLMAARGHACGLRFKAAEHIRLHPEFAWQKELLRDLDASPWTTFRIADR